MTGHSAKPKAPLRGLFYRWLFCQLVIHESDPILGLFLVCGEFSHFIEDVLVLFLGILLLEVCFGELDADQGFLCIVEKFLDDFLFGFHRILV